MTFHVSLNSQPVAEAKLSVPSRGVWYADIVLANSATIAIGSKATLDIGGDKWQGTAATSEVFGDRTHVRLLGGGGGWGKAVVAKGYDNGLGVKPSTVLEQLATAVGETIGVTPTPRLGAHYSRIAGPASATIEDIARAPLQWFIGRDGKTNVVERSTGASVAVNLINFDPLTKAIRFTLDDLSKLDIGSSLTAANLANPFIVAAFEVSVTATSLTIEATSGKGAEGDISDILYSIVSTMLNARKLGLYRYRVTTQVGQLVELQAVHKEKGVPDQATVELWPGLPGVEATLKLGSEVNVAFLGGDTRFPVITAFGGGLNDSATSLTIGKGPAAGVVRQGDTFEGLLPPAVFSGTVGGAPATGVLSWVTPKIVGVATGGSSIVKVGAG